MSKITELPDEFPTAEGFQLLRDYYTNKTVDKTAALLVALNVEGFLGREAIGGSPVPMHATKMPQNDIESAWDVACSPGVKAGGMWLSILAPIILQIVQKLLAGQ